jgi:hypothetical protein
MTLPIRTCERADAEAIGGLAGEFQPYLWSLGDRTTFAWGAAEYRRDGFDDDPAFESLVADDTKGGHRGTQAPRSHEGP